MKHIHGRDAWWYYYRFGIGTIINNLDEWSLFQEKQHNWGSQSLKAADQATAVDRNKRQEERRVKKIATAVILEQSLQCLTGQGTMPPWERWWEQA